MPQTLKFQDNLLSMQAQAHSIWWLRHKSAKFLYAICKYEQNYKYLLKDLQRLVAQVYLYYPLDPRK